LLIRDRAAKRINQNIRRNVGGFGVFNKIGEPELLGGFLFAQKRGICGQQRNLCDECLYIFCDSDSRNSPLKTA
jgi:hypothetical protein